MAHRIRRIAGIALLGTALLLISMAQNHRPVSQDETPVQQIKDRQNCMVAQAPSDVPLHIIDRYCHDEHRAGAN